MYRLVFSFIPTRIFVGFLFAILLLQPVGHAHADEGTTTESVAPVTQESASGSSDNPGTSNNSQTASDTAAGSSDSLTQAPVKDIPAPDATSSTQAAEDVLQTAATNTDATTSVASSSASSGNMLETSAAATSTEPANTATTTQESTNAATSTVTQGVGTTSPQASSTDVTVSTKQTGDVSAGDASQATASQESASSSNATTIEHAPVATSTGTSVEFSDLNRYQFGAQECTSVGEGAYYCSKQNDPSLTPEEDGVYAAPDNEGDSEIFIKLHGKTTQITHNTLEDKAPYYDPISNTIVWHRLIDGRYEIMQFDLSKGEETQITHNDVNDMEPTASGNYIVWQRWVNDNWEIMLYDGHAEKQITHNDTHDVAPHIKGGYVIWHATGQGGNAYIGVYEIATGLTSMIEDQDGGKVENPRFVLVYDTTYDNGDVVTKGYDFESKSVVPLSAIPHQAPQNLPNPDATGETRAFVQSQTSTVKGIVEGTSTPSSGSGEPPSDDSLASSTAASSTSTIDASSTSLYNASTTQSSSVLSAASTTINMHASSSSPLQLDEYDVVVPPYSDASSTQELNSTTTPDFVE